jgi:hypothetical protein
MSLKVNASSEYNFGVGFKVRNWSLKQKDLNSTRETNSLWKKEKNTFFWKKKQF